MYRYLDLTNEQIRGECWCVANNMTYGLISFAIGLVLGLWNNILLTAGNEKPWSKRLLSLSTIAFIFGIFFLIIFGVLYYDLADVPILS